jgi:hypothetical protein
MRQCLPERNVLYAHYQHKRETEILAHAKQLLQQYEQIGNQSRRQIDHDEWWEYYRQAYHCLIEKGYYKPERWLGEIQTISVVVEPLADKSFDETKAQKHCLNNHALKNYYEELVRHLSACMQAATIIFSGRVDPAKGIGQTAMASIIGGGTTFALAKIGISTAIEESLPILINGIPVGGAIVNCIATLVKKGYEYSRKLTEQRNAARICAWSITPSDADRLAKALGLRLTSLRENTLA